MKPATADAYRLFHEGTLVLADVEATGMRIDVGRLDAAIGEVSAEIDRLTDRMRSDKTWKVWRRRYGDKSSLGSRVQLAGVLFGELGYESPGETRLGKRKRADEEALNSVDLPFVRDWLRVEKLRKLRSTNLLGVKRELVGDRIHPVYNLNLVRTFRSSCDSPNIQQLPIRDEESGRMIRECFVPLSRDHVLVEVDYSALEFRVCACVWNDSAMLDYASDPSKDIHRDMAALCYRLKKSEVTKQARFYAKNQFVFPTLYGSWWKNTSRNLWDAIGKGSLETVGGTSLYEHLRGEGIRTLEDYASHVERVESRFCCRFPEWAERKERWLDLYRRRGWFRTVTGFVCSGIYSRNELYNYPIQGPAFHCLLWSLVQMVKWIRRSKMKSRVDCQIHDSIRASVHRDELDEYLGKVREVMTVDVRRHWDWIRSPLDVEVEMSETNWHEKRKVT